MVAFPVETASSLDPEQLEQRRLTETVANETIENFVTCIHRARLAGLSRDIIVSWSKSLMGHSLHVLVENPSEENHSTCKIDLKTWQFWGKKGLKSFKVGERRVDVFWDLRTAKFSSSPEPVSDYYVALVSEKELVLLLGDQKTEAYKRTRSKPSPMDAALVHKKESVFAKRCFCTRTMLGKGKREHHIIIESALSGPYDPEMWISVDGVESLRIPNLHWRFRGNETLLVDDVPVQIFWDVHDWLYNSNESGPGTFIFMQGTLECEFDNDYGRRNLDHDAPSGENCDLRPEELSCTEFCHFLYAWMTE
ncbi:uncharacterized protein LOC113771986 [Coffea eugenioides]|uniref:uncharacterized protein LOC113771986 n=1 Tax=Coffea eugenioides TaxID=49369 RepID=UPI000F611793|nr:uncharacterized protein LOC113771986 [Coffea eugenioides]